MTAEHATSEPAITELLRTVADLATPLERAAVLHSVGRVAAESIDSELGFVGVADGPDHLALTAVSGAKTSALETIRVERGRGLGGKVFALETPDSVVDYTTASSITHEYDSQIIEEGLAGVLCLPLVLEGDVTGVAYVSDRVPRVYTDVMIDRVVGAVEAAKIALALADRSRLLTEAAVEVERERTTKALDESVGVHLGQISSIATAILADASSSAELISQAKAIVDTAGQASLALTGSIAEIQPLAKSHAFSDFGLSARELEVVALASRGLSNPEIASELFLARGTVKAYMESVLQKLGARNRVEAVMIAARAGIIDL